MQHVVVCLQIDFSLSCSAPSEMERMYQDTVKPILSLLYAAQKINVSLSFTGPQLAWLFDRHPEALALLSELVSRRQAELLGGGYYSPLLPLLLPVDRSGQIEKLTSLITSATGKRPRGMNIPGSVWDPSLVTTLQCCNMEYVHLDQSLVPQGRTKYLPVITGELGKTIAILPLYRDFVPAPDLSAAAWRQSLLQTVRKELSKKTDGSAPAIVTIPFSAEEFLSFSGWPSFAAVTEEEDGLLFTTPQKYLKAAGTFIVSYIPAGTAPAISSYATEPYRAVKPRAGLPLAIHDFLNLYPQNRRLYERMMYISLIVSQYHGDKVRRSAARERLWQAQAGLSYVSLAKGTPAVAQCRQESYVFLNDASDIVQGQDAKESLTRFDYNADGLNEYVCSMEKFTAVISPKAGAVTELDIRRGGGNYAANLSRLEQFDGVTDEYQRGIFIEHLFEGAEKESYLSLRPSGTGIFSQIRFSERKFDAKRREVQMEGRADFSALRLPVSLRKNYTFSSGGITVQYILKNESPLQLKAFFAVESNFAQMLFSQDADAEYEAELVHGGKRETASLLKATSFEDGIQAVLLTNVPNKTSFVIEPNESAGFALLPVEFSRPALTGDGMFRSRSYCMSFFWEIDLAAGMEMEKTVSLSFVSARKRSRKQG